MSTKDRRDFIKKTMVGGSGIMLGGSTLSAASYSNVMGANDTIRVGIIGLHGHGSNHIRNFLPIKGVRIAALCDVDSSQISRRKQELSKAGVSVEGYSDMRRLLDNKDIDVITIATPNHWHALAAVWGCQAGKDVMVEKPVSHSIWEGRKIVEAARKYDRIVQADLDRRSSTARAKAYEYLQSGKLGKVLFVKSVNYKRRRSIGLVHVPQPIPSTVDYNLWCGPTRMKPLMRQRLHYDWHWQYNTGNAEIGNNGPHTLDCVRWGLGMKTLPASVYSLGGRYGYIDNGDVPNTHLCVYDYQGIPIVYESRGLPENPNSDNMDGLSTISSTGKKVFFPHNRKSPNNHEAFICENGILHGTEIYDNAGNRINTFEEDSDSQGPKEHFVNGLRSRRKSDLRIDIEEGHLSTAFCHLGNISYKMGEPAKPAEIEEIIGGDKFVRDAFEGMKKHLQAHGIDVAEQLPALGPKLHFDSKTETFHGEKSERANLFLKDTYREPFVIPDSV
jgi:predicted dehydrogenase